MVQLRTHRTALALYGVLLILPTLVLGFLQWHQIAQEQSNELGAVPRDAEDAARRFREMLSDRVHKLVESESRRGLEQYARWYCPDSTPEGEVTLLPTPLTQEARPLGILAWFAFDLNEQYDADVDVFFGGPSSVGAQRGAELRRAARDLLKRYIDEGWLRRVQRVGLQYDELELPLRVIATSRAGEDDADCLRAQRMLLAEPVHMVVGQLYLQFYREEDGTPRIVATRRVLAEPLPHLVGLNECVHRLSKGLGLVQGFFVDPQWFFGDLADSVARSVLTSRERFLREGETCCDGRTEYHAEIRPVADLNLETYRPEEKDYGRFRIAVDTAEIEQRFRARAVRFFGVAAMLLLSLSTGMLLLVRSVRRDLEQASRTENFVAAVTHELRTPLSSIKLHGEMLLDGWAHEPHKQQEYYRRILRETERLSTLVERVLEKARLASGPARPFPGDLSKVVGELQAQLLQWRSTDQPDLAFDLEDGLPSVLLTAEAVASILVNLIENARKYAPVDFSRDGAEPIRVVTRRDGEGAVLEVLDRGPGIPAEERRRIFDAFYRIGNESTRTSRGTGLGLHLVALHAQSLGGRAEALPRPGGGSCFRISFRPAFGRVA